MIEREKSSMKSRKLSERGIITLILVLTVIISTFLLTLITNIQEVHSQEWQKEIGIQFECE